MKILFLLLFPFLLFAQHGTNVIMNQFQVSSIYHAYGGFQDSSTTIAVDQGSWTTFTNATENLWGGSEADGFVLSGDTMTVSFTGDIVGIVSLTFEGANVKNYDFRLYNITQTRQEGFNHGMTALGGNNLTLTFPIYMEATVGDEFIIQVMGTDTAIDITATHGQFLLQYLHD